MSGDTLDSWNPGDGCSDRTKKLFGFLDESGSLFGPGMFYG